MADVVLIRPIYSTIMGKGKGSSECRPPAGLLYLAAPLVKSGFDVFILDQAKDPQWQETLKRQISAKTICVGFTCLTGFMIVNGLRTAGFIRSFARCPIVWGGVHPSLEPETTIKSEFVDIIVDGEGEETFLELVTALKHGNNLENVPGIAFKKDGKVVKTAFRKMYPLETLPEVPFHLVDFEMYRGHPSLKDFFRFSSDRAVSLETSRGCNFRCSYCVLASKPYVHHANWRGMSAKKIADMVESTSRRNGIKAFAFIEDNFFVDMKRSNQFLDELEKRCLQIEWFADARMDTILRKMDHSFLVRMQKLGLKSLGIGIESGSNRILKKIRKGETRETYLKANRKLADYDIVPRYGLIVGFPGETPEDLAWTYDLVLHMILDNPRSAIVLNKLIPNPQTPVFQECLEAGFKAPESFEQWAFFSDTSWGQKKREPWIDEASFHFIMNFFFIHDLLRKTAATGKITPFMRLLSKILLLDLRLRREKRMFGFRFEGAIHGFFKNAMTLWEKGSFLELGRGVLPWFSTSSTR